MSERKRRQVVFWYAVVDPYMTDRFNALAKSDRINFECWFTHVREPGRSWVVPAEQLAFPHQFLPAWHIGKHVLGSPYKHWKRSNPEILISFHGMPAVALSSLQTLRPRGQLVYYVEKTFDTWVKRTPMKELVKHVLLKSADAFLTPGPDADKYVRHYSSAPLYRLSHVVQYEHFAKASPLRVSPEIAARRRQLGLEGFIFLNVGRMWHQKGIGTLIDAFKEIERAGIDATLLLVGDGVDRDVYISEVKSSALKRVKFIDFVQQETLPEIYALANAFVFPTRGDPYGLVVDEAMASGLPVIASRSAGEIETRIIPNQTGLLTPPDDAAYLRDAMIYLAQNPEKAACMGQRGAEFMSRRDLNHWVFQMETAIGQIMEQSSPRRGPVSWTRRKEP